MRTYAFTVLESAVPIEVGPRIGEEYRGPELVWPTAVKIVRDDGWTTIEPIGPEILDDIPYGPMLLAERCDELYEVAMADCPARKP